MWIPSPLLRRASHTAAPGGASSRPRFTFSYSILSSGWLIYRDGFVVDRRLSEEEAAECCRLANSGSSCIYEED